MKWVRKIRKREASQLLAFVLAAALLCGNGIAALLPVQATRCSHVHDRNCGFADARECQHAHNDACGYAEARKCGHVCSEDLGCVVDDENGNKSCAHTAHDNSCGYVEGVPCGHTDHDAACGYAAASPCTHVHDANCGGLVNEDGQDAAAVTPGDEEHVHTYEDGDNLCDICGEPMSEALSAFLAAIGKLSDLQANNAPAEEVMAAYEEALGLYEALSEAEKASEYVKAAKGALDSFKSAATLASVGEVVNINGTPQQNLPCGTSGSNGSNVTYTLTYYGDTEGDGYTLTISGAGEMRRYYGNTPPWKAQLSSIKAVVVNEGVTNIGESAFENATNLKSVSIAATVKKIQRLAFSGCGQLEDITIPSGVEKIGEKAFASTGLKAISLPDTVTYLGNDGNNSDIGDQGNVFYGCKQLKTVRLSPKLTSIAMATFSECESLDTLNFGDLVNLTFIGGGAFYNTGFKRIDLTKNTKLGTIAGFNGGSPDSYGNYGGTFGRCKYLQKVLLPPGVTDAYNTNRPNVIALTLGTNLFAGCSSLKEVVFHSATQELRNNTGGDGAARNIFGKKEVTGFAVKIWLPSALSNYDTGSERRVKEIVDKEWWWVDNIVDNENDIHWLDGVNQHNDSQHWGTCSVGACQETLPAADHTYQPLSANKTDTGCNKNIKGNPGDKYCTVCGHVKKEGGTAGAASLTAEAPTFDSVNVGYTQPAAKPITITNGSGTAATIKSVTVPANAKFTIAGPTGDQSLAANTTDNTSWTIQPKADLLAGTYTETITVTYDNDQTTTAVVSFTVNSVTLAPVSSNRTDIGHGDVTFTSTKSGDYYYIVVKKGERVPTKDQILAAPKGGDCTAGTNRKINLNGLKDANGQESRDEYEVYIVVKTENDGTSDVLKMVVPPCVDFGNQTIDTTGSKNVTVSAPQLPTGSSNASYTVSVTGTDGTANNIFAITNASGWNPSQPLNMTFKPTADNTDYSGTVTITVSYTNEDNIPGSMTITMPVTGRGVNAPVLRPLSSVRVNEPNGNVTFSSTHQGTYYYVVREAGDNRQAPAAADIIAARKIGTCDNGNNTIHFTDLRGTGAKRVYIVMTTGTDGTGQTSNVIEMVIPPCLDFGEKTVNSSTPQTVTLPRGFTPVGTPAVTGGNGNYTARIENGELVVTFTPTTTGASINATVEVKVNGGDGNSIIVTVPVTGSGTTEATPPTNPETPPTNPETPPTNPETPPTNPVTPPTNPATPPTNPATPPTNPATPPTNPATPPTNPATPPTNPATPPTNPATPPTNPGTTTFVQTRPTPPINPTATPLPDLGYGFPTYRNETPDPNDPNSPEIIVVIDDDDVPLAYRKVSDPEDDDNMIYMEDPSIPLAGPKADPKAGAWALVNLILTAVSVLAGIVALVRYMTRKRKEDEEEDDKKAKMEDEKDEEEKEKHKWHILSILAAVVSVIVFFLTENMRLPMQLVDKWTIVMAILALLTVPGLLQKRREEEREEENTRYA